MADLLLHRPSSSLFFSILFFFFPLLTFAFPEADALLKLKESFQNASSLDSWRPDSTPCNEKSPWDGVVCFNGAVIGLRLGWRGLSGTIDIEALLKLSSLRSISFMHNGFSGPLPSFQRLNALKAIYLTGNQFSGEIPSDFFSKLTHLKKVWISKNAFVGPIPDSVTHMAHLMDFHVELNGFTGKIPAINVPTLRSFNVSHNALQGQIPASLEKFDASAFTGNDGLCGETLGKDCGDTLEKWSSGKLAMVSLVMVAAVCLLVAAVMARARRKWAGEFKALDQSSVRGVDSREEMSVAVADSHHRKKESSSSSSSSVRKGSSASKSVGELVMVNEEKGIFALTDLMKAAAEVLGAGGLGSAYKAVMTNGTAVVVKRMREMDRIGRDGFESQIRRLGRLRHPNILPPLAFHCRKEEKLVVFPFVSKGSLLYLLHGNRGHEREVLDWPTRLKVIVGIARGMAHLHAELPNSELPHGNLKSSNVLIESDNESLIADFGYSPLVGPSQASHSLLALKCPESIQYNQVSPKSDVYCFGILILEILTGKFPSQYLNHGKGGTDVIEWAKTGQSGNRDLYDPEILGPDGPWPGLERLLHIGIEFTEADPARRPTLREAAMRIEEVATEEGYNQARPAQPSPRDKFEDISFGDPQTVNQHNVGSRSTPSSESIGS